MPELRADHLPPVRAFRRRLLRAAAISFGFLVLSTGLGVLGFWLVGLSPLDAFMDAAMLLSGMGLVVTTPTAAGKIFASLFALYAGLAFFGIAALLFAPMFHRMLHRFHLEDTGRR
jgi:hypothetical protein